MEREKTNSITQLVKIIAKEVFDEEIKKHNLNIPHSFDTKSLGNCFFNEIRSSLKQTGTSWLNTEDELLIEEVKIAVAQIAENHGRSFLAIKQRMLQKNILHCLDY